MNYLYFVSVAFLLIKSVVKYCINEIHAPYDFISNYYKFDTACYGVVSVFKFTKQINKDKSSNLSTNQNSKIANENLR